MAVVFVASGPAGARAAQDGVTIDRGSPAAKEYALPIEKARRDANDGGRDRRTTPGEQSAPLFGRGISSRSTPASSSTPSGQARGAASGDAGAGRKRPPGGRRNAATRSEKPTDIDSEDRRIDAAVTGVGGGGPGGGGAGGLDGALVLLLGGAAVALIGGLGGLLARRRPTPTA